MLPFSILKVGEEPRHCALHPQLREDGQAKGHPQQELPQSYQFWIQVAREKEQQIQYAEADPDIGQQG